MQPLYTAKASRALDQRAIDAGISGDTLMQRAGKELCQVLLQRYPRAKKVAVLCGVGNNAGDGFIFARLAQAHGCEVVTILADGQKSFQNEALTAFEKLKKTKVSVQDWQNQNLKDHDVIIDALLGSGLDRDVTGVWRNMIQSANDSGRPIIAADIPSGLHADTGRVCGVAIRAQKTVTFIGLKQGLFTNEGPDHSGEVIFSDLKIPAEVCADFPHDVIRLSVDDFKQDLTPRRKNSHKRSHGHVLVVGGEKGFLGASILSCQGALRSGAGYVSLATRRDHAPLVATQHPEILAAGCERYNEVDDKLRQATVAALGPGLGQGSWSKMVYGSVVRTTLPLVMDADALNLLALDPIVRGDWILTPHPGEAARLLHCTVMDIQNDRFAAVKELQKRYAGVVVLKGCGTLVCDGESVLGLCPYGNPGMAVAGMGDTLTGIIAALVAQGLSLFRAACLGVCVHGLAGDFAVIKGERGMLPSDLLPHVRNLLNQYY